jgi:protein-S-isoprenylcysteine O-methyltransferase Ste14
MQFDQPRARIAYPGGAVARVKNLVLKTLLVLGGVVTLASAFVLSLVFVAIGLVVVLTAGGYLWWQTRELRRQMRARMQGQPYAAGNVIEGEVISPERPRH